MHRGSVENGWGRSDKKSTNHDAPSLFSGTTEPCRHPLGAESVFEPCYRGLVAVEQEFGAGEIPWRASHRIYVTSVMLRRILAASPQVVNENPPAIGA